MKPEFRCAPSTAHGLEFAYRFVRRSRMNTKHLVRVIVGVMALFTVACGYSIKTATDYAG